MSANMIVEFIKVCCMVRYKLLLFTLITVCSSSSSAQGISVGDLINKSVFTRLSKSLNEVMRQRMIVSPEEIIVSQDSDSITIHFSNPTKDTMTAEIIVYTTPPPQVKVFESSTVEDNRPIPSFLADSDPRKRSQKEKSPGTYKPLIKDWINNLPDSLILAPGEVREVSLKIIVPTGNPEGLYVVWIASAVEIKTKNSLANVSKGSEEKLQVKVGGGLSGNERRAVLSATKIMYNMTGTKSPIE